MLAWLTLLNVASDSLPRYEFNFILLYIGLIDEMMVFRLKDIFFCLKIPIPLQTPKK